MQKEERKKLESFEMFIISLSQTLLREANDAKQSNAFYSLIGSYNPCNRHDEEVHLKAWQNNYQRRSHRQEEKQLM